MKKFTASCLGCSLLLAVLFLLFAGGLLFLLSRVFSDTPVNRPDFREIDRKELLGVQQKLSGELLKILNVREDTADQVSSIELTSGEVNTLLTFLAGTHSPTLPLLQEQVSRRNPGIRLENGWAEIQGDCLNLVYSQDAGVRTPFGSLLNFNISLRTGYRAGQPYCLLTCLKIGNLTLRRNESGSAKDLRKLFSPEDLERIRTILETVEIKNDTLLIRYRPCGIRKLLLESTGGRLPMLPLPATYSGGDGHTDSADTNAESSSSEESPPIINQPPGGGRYAE